LKQIRESENIEISDTQIKILAKTADGDFRAAINDLEVFAQGEGEIGFRENKKNIFDVLKIVFKSRSIDNARQIIRESDKNLEEVMWWLEQNIPAEYEKPEEVAKAFEYLAKADLFRARIHGNRNYRFMFYINEFLAAISLAKEKPYRKFSSYRPPQRLVMLGKSKSERIKTDAVCEELGKKLHCSKRIVRNEYLPFLKAMDKTNINQKISTRSIKTKHFKL